MTNDILSGVSFPEQLKTRTAEAHTRLEELPISKSILSESLDRESYAHYLKLMRDVVAETETRIFPLTTEAISDLESRRKLAHIEADLNHASTELSEPKTVFHKENMSPAFALGVLYVVEGSALGGRFILKNVEKSLGYSAETGASYFAGYGNTTGSMWKHFMNELSQYEATHNAGDEIMAGAVFAFESIEQHFLRG